MRRAALSLGVEPYANLSETLCRIILGANELSKSLNIILHSASGTPSSFSAVPRPLYGGNAAG
jgi:hypothetical protein